MSKVYIIATTREWNEQMAENLSSETGYRFEQVSNNLDLNLNFLNVLNPRYIFFPHWSHKISREILEKYECVIFHMTDLPFGRGGSPLQNLIIRGVSDTKICALQCVEEIDAGPIYMKRELSLDGNAQEIYERASTIIESMILEMVTNETIAIPQYGEPTIFKRRSPAESDLSSSTSIERAYDMIRMLDAEGYPHAFLEVGKLRYEFRNAQRIGGHLIADVAITQVTNSHDDKEYQ